MTATPPANFFRSAHPSHAVDRCPCKQAADSLGWPLAQEIPPMARVSTYLNFNGRTEAAFELYRSIFKTDYAMPTVRIKDIPPDPGKPRTQEQGNRIAHMALPILGGHILMGTDVPEVAEGNNVSIMLEPDSRGQAEQLFAALSAGGKVIMPLADMFWGAYFGQLVDEFGVQWLVNVDHAR
jgi:PhnB protein